MLSRINMEKIKEEETWGRSERKSTSEERQLQCEHVVRKAGLNLYPRLGGQEGREGRTRWEEAGGPILCSGPIYLLLAAGKRSQLHPET